MEEYQEQEDSGLELDIELLEEKGSSTTSLEDLYGYAVFSEQFQKDIDKYNTQKEENQQIYVQNVFYNKKEEEIDKYFELVFQSESQNVIKTEYNNTNETESWLQIAGFILIGVLITGGILMIIERVQRRNKTNVNKNNNI